VVREKFAEHTQYSLTVRDEGGKQRPMNVYVYRLYDDFMIVRQTDKSGLLLKLRYDDVSKIVRSKDVPRERRYMLPEEVLKLDNWKERSTMQAYASSAGWGK
jgi:hypothetical protein